MSAAKSLVKAAIEARQSAYAPYSGFRVGAAIALNDGSVFTGVNVENASYGLTVCAERNAIAAAVLAGATRGGVYQVAVVADAEGPTPPCGACRQVLAEFATAKTKLLLHNLRDGKTREVTFGELQPLPFTPDALQ